MTTVDLDPLRTRLAALGRRHTPADVASAMRAEGVIVTDAAVIDTVEALRRSSVGAGPLEPLLHEPGVTDILVNGPDRVYVDRGAGLELTEIRFPHDAEVRRLAQRLAASVGRRLDDAVPFVDARLADGSRVHAVLGTLASPGTCISLRVPAARTFSLDDCVASGSLSPGAAQLLSQMMAAKLSFLISGAPGRARPPCSRPCSAWCRLTSGSWSSRTRASSHRITRTWCGWRAGQPTPSWPAPSP